MVSLSTEEYAMNYLNSAGLASHTTRSRLPVVETGTNGSPCCSKGIRYMVLAHRHVVIHCGTVSQFPLCAARVSLLSVVI